METCSSATLCCLGLARQRLYFQSSGQITWIQMSSGVAGVSLSPGAGPRSGSVGEQSFRRRSSRCGRKPETQAGMRQGLVAAALRSDLVDRSVRLVLIPAGFLFLFGAAVTKCCAVKEECGYKFTACEVPSRAEFIENILASFPVPNPTKRRRKKKPCPRCSNIPHPLLWDQGIHFHPASSCFAG